LSPNISIVILKKNQSILGENSRPSFTKSTSLPTTTVEKKERKKNEWCYLLLTYVLHCKKNKAKSTKQTLSRLSQTGHQFVCQQVQRSQHFLNFSSKHHFYQLSCKRLQNFDEIFVKSNTKKNSSKCTEMKEKMVEGTPQLLLQKTRM